MKKIPKDKLMHAGVNFIAFIATTLIAWFIYHFFHLTKLATVVTTCCTAWCMCIGLSVGKEYGDSKASGNEWSWGDIVADAIGAGLACIIMIVIEMLIIK